LEVVNYCDMLCLAEISLKPPGLAPAGDLLFDKRQKVGKKRFPLAWGIAVAHGSGSITSTANDTDRVS
ncbi:hypothetical protein, partial [Trichloromonas sp.]|uniref:hypothetical protein n=1 Tax=Trichloromonas sp. TaxID=3069249 RepID=UPI003D814ACB